MMTSILNLPKDGKSYRPVSGKQRPEVIAKSIANLVKFCEMPFQWLKNLRTLRLERRSAVAKVAQVILAYTDLATLRVGVPNANGKMFYPTLRFIAYHAGLPLKRTQRAINELIAHGYLQSYPRHHKVAENEYYGLAAIRQVSRTLFYHLGVSQLRLERSIHAKRKQQEKDHAVATPQSTTTHCLSSLAEQVALQALALKAAHPLLSGYQLFKATLFTERPRKTTA